MAVPVLRQEYAARIRVALERDAEEVVSLPLHPVRRGPYGRDALDPFVARARLQSHALVLRSRVEVVDDLEGLLFALGPVYAGQVAQVVERSLGVVAKRAANFSD